MQSAGSSEAPTRPILLASAAALLAGWVAAGCVGVLADPLGMGIVYLLVTVVIVSSWGSREASRIPLGLALGIWLHPLIAPATQVQTVLLVAATVGLLAIRLKGPDRDGLTQICLALFVFAAYRWACESIPIVWWASNQLGNLLGHAAGWLANRPLDIGASFAGLDFLTLSLTLIALSYLSHQKGVCLPFLETEVAEKEKKGGRLLFLFPLLGVLGVHLIYLVLLAETWDLVDWLPQNPDPTFDHPYVPPSWDWSRAVATTLPWNLPAVGAVLHAAVATIGLRSILRHHNTGTDVDSSVESAARTARAAAERRSERRLSGRSPRAKLLLFAGLSAAILLPLVAFATIGGRDLQQVRILANGQGDLDWQVPEHGRFGRDSAGTFGVLPSFVASLGGGLSVSSELSEAELRETDVLVLLRPAAWLTESQQERVWKYVRDGGSLLVVAGLESPEDAPRQGINELLADTSLRIRRDITLSACDDWEVSGQVFAHPALTRRVGQPVPLEPGGSSIDLGWRAVPLAVGRWGWSDPGGEALTSNVARCEPGERLGDLVLAAEQRVGKGTVIVLGTERPLTNEGIVWGHMQVARLLDYLAHPPTRWYLIGRQFLSASLIVLLLAAALSTLNASRVTTLALLWASAITIGSLTAPEFEPAVPDGRRLAAADSSHLHGLAYLDASHLELYSTRDWVFDGTNGLALNLMRNGYLTLGLRDWTDERLQTADVLVSIAPGRRFSDRERDQIDRFVSDGGLLICTVGAEQAEASRELLARFRIRVPASPVPTTTKSYEPIPMGHVRSLYLDANQYGVGDYRVGVTFHAAWPVESQGEPAEVLVAGLRERPIVVSRDHGNGTVVVVGDSSFAMNKNLEYIGGEPFNGRYENSYFWRWLISRLTTDQQWFPPAEELNEAESVPATETDDVPFIVEPLEPSASQEATP